MGLGKGKKQGQLREGGGEEWESRNWRELSVGVFKVGEFKRDMGVLIVGEKLKVCEGFGVGISVEGFQGLGDWKQRFLNMRLEGGVGDILQERMNGEGGLEGGVKEGFWDGWGIDFFLSLNFCFESLGRSGFVFFVFIVGFVSYIGSCYFENVNYFWCEWVGVLFFFLLEVEFRLQQVIILVLKGEYIILWMEVEEERRS